MSLTVADRAQLERWWAESVARGGLPEDVEPVQVRLIRLVGRARLPDAGEVYLKVMGFPRPKDRLRYLFRALPAQHEARMLRVLTDSGIPCPEVLDARGRRTLGLPRFSFLVLRGLDRAERRPDGSEIARLAGDLAKAGVFHPDLHRGNQVPLVDGRLAVLDLHSARLARPGLSRRQRLIVAARLIGEPGPLAEDPVPLVRAGLLQDAELVVVRRLVACNSRRRLVGRVRRCFRQSTEFQRTVQWNGVLYQRRGPMSGGTWIFGGRELVRLWIGDRALEVFEGRSPALRALFRRAMWLPGQHSVYIAKPLDHAALSVLAPTLLGGYTAFRRLLQGETPLGNGVGPRSGTQGV